LKVINIKTLEPTPHQLERKKQREKYVWYGIYDATAKEELNKIIEGKGVESVVTSIGQYNAILSKYNDNIKLFIKKEPVIF